MPKTSFGFYLNIIIVAALIFALGHFAFHSKNSAQTPTTTDVKTENSASVYDRVAKTSTIRCGYTSWDPLFFSDVKTGEKKGIFHDLMEEAGKRLDLKIVWQEEIGWGSIVESIKTGRVDMACAGYWLNPGRIKNLQPSVPQIYSPMYIYVRANETRVFNTPEDLNSKNYTISTIDGSAENQIVAKRFAKSKNTTLPELNTSADTILNLITNKADFLLLDSATANGYMASNPDKIKNAFPDKPMTLFPTVMLLPPQDMAFKSMIDNILLDIEHDGTLDAILKKYNTEHLFLRNPPAVAN